MVVPLLKIPYIHCTHIYMYGFCQPYTVGMALVLSWIISNRCYKPVYPNCFQ